MAKRRSDSAYDSKAHLFDVCTECGFVNDQTPHGDFEANIRFFNTPAECVKCGSEEMVKGWRPQIQLVVHTVNGQFDDIEGTPNRTMWQVKDFKR